MGLILFVTGVAVWELVVYRTVARLAGPSLLQQWLAQLMFRSLLALGAYGLLTFLVLGAFSALVTGAVFVTLTIPLALMHGHHPPSARLSESFQSFFRRPG